VEGTRAERAGAVRMISTRENQPGRLIEGRVGAARLGSVSPNLNSGLSSGLNPSVSIPTATRAGLIPAQHTDPCASFRTALTREIGEEAMRRHFGDDVRLAVEDHRVDILVGSSFHKGTIDRRFSETLRQLALAGGLAEVRVLVDDTMRTAMPVSVVHTRPVSPEQLANRRSNPSTSAMRAAARRGRESQHELDSFIVGSSNRMALSAVTRVANDAQGREFSPLFLHGPSGVGKSHLLQGAAAQFRRRHPGATVRYTTAEAFTNAYIASVKDNSLEKFRKAWRGVDLLCVDDVHFLSRKESTQSELLHTFDALDLDGSRILLASDEHPRRIAALSAGLMSRFMSGAVVRIDPPDEVLRLMLVRTLAARRGARLSADAASLIADRAGMPDNHRASVRDLEGVLTQVVAVSQLLPEFLGQDGEIGLLAVRRALGLGEWTAQRPSRGRPVRFETILEQSCKLIGVDRSDVLSSSRHRRVVLARTMVSYLAREMTTMSFPEVARAQHRPSHSTVVAAFQRMAEMIARDEPVKIGPDFDGLTMGQLAERVRARIETASER